MTEPTSPPPVTDSPLIAAPWPRPGKWDVFKTVYGDCARPTVLYLVGLSTAYAIIVIASRKAPDWSSAAIFMGALFAGLVALYGAKAAEVYGQAREAAKTEVAKANASATTTA